MKRAFFFVILGLLAVLVVGCSSGGSDPAAVIEAYNTALVTGNNAQSAALSCADWEESAGAEGASFEGVEVKLEGMACSLVSEDGNRAVVTCDGSFVFSYAGGEDEEISLDRRNYVLAFEGGEWRMCGYE
ncbi:nuclear transport factor 2 family protein [bacterium]|nr:nuclear transport factor 2 family protein [bacterium]